MLTIVLYLDNPIYRRHIQNQLTALAIGGVPNGRRGSLAVISHALHAIICNIRLEWNLRGMRSAGVASDAKKMWVSMASVSFEPLIPAVAAVSAAAVALRVCKYAYLDSRIATK